MKQSETVEPSDFIIARKRKKYKFAHFANALNCFEAEEFTLPTSEKRPVVLEIGAGTGLFSLELARRHPERFYIAADVKADRLQAGARAALEDSVDNIVFVRVHTESLPRLLQPGSISEIWLTFSDPFPKKRYAKHRLTHPRFLEPYSQLLVKTGTLHQKTDNHALFDWSLEQFVTSGWRITELSYDLHESNLPDDYKVMTTFEQKYSSEGLPIFYLTAALAK
jgi:tRNA (guanine-N7-)-methyltransferase